MRGYAVYMTLTADGLIPEPSSRVGDNSEKELEIFKFRLVLAFPHIHGDSIDGIGAVAGRIVETLTNRIQTSVLRGGSEYARAVLKSNGILRNPNVESRVKTHAFVLT
jgi:hypothetical protein